MFRETAVKRLLVFCETPFSLIKVNWGSRPHLILILKLSRQMQIYTCSTVCYCAKTPYTCSYSSGNRRAPAHIRSILSSWAHLSCQSYQCIPPKRTTLSDKTSIMHENRCSTSLLDLSSPFILPPLLSNSTQNTAAIMRRFVSQCSVAHRTIKPRSFVSLEAQIGLWKFYEDKSDLHLV